MAYPRLERLIQIAQKTGAPVIVASDREDDEPQVLLPLAVFEELIDHAHDHEHGHDEPLEEVSRPEEPVIEKSPVNEEDFEVPTLEEIQEKEPTSAPFGEEQFYLEPIE